MGPKPHTLNPWSENGEGILALKENKERRETEPDSLAGNRNWKSCDHCRLYKRYLWSEEKEREQEGHTYRTWDKAPVTSEVIPHDY